MCVYTYTYECMDSIHALYECFIDGYTVDVGICRMDSDWV